MPLQAQICPVKITRDEKKIFDTLSYSEKLDYWDKNNFYYGHDLLGNKLEVENNSLILSIIPTMEERNIYYEWYAGHLKKWKPNHFDFDKIKEDYLFVMENNNNDVEVTEIELKKYKFSKEHFYQSWGNGLTNSFAKGYDSIFYKKEIDFDIKYFNGSDVGEILRGRMYCQIIGFLERQLIVLKRNRANPKEEIIENNEIEFEKENLELRTKLIVLNELGVLKYLSSKYPQFTNSTELAKFLSEIILEKKPKEDFSKVFNNFRTELGYINMPFANIPKGKNPQTKTAIKKVNSILFKYGLPVINDDKLN